LDLHGIETYLRPTDLLTVGTWKPGHAWLAGGTWLFSEPQPQLKTLVDLEPLGWSAIAWQGETLAIGATCTFAQLLSYPWEPDWRAIALFKNAVSALAASFKVTHLATIGGNLCLALAVGVMAPVLVTLDATYEIWHATAPPRYIAAKDFQLGIQQTQLKAGEVLRRVLIPQANLFWETSFQRFGIAATDPALSLVVTAQEPQTLATRIGLGACLPAPCLLQFDRPPTLAQVAESLRSLPWLDDMRASAAYRQHVTAVLIARALGMT